MFARGVVHDDLVLRTDTHTCACAHVRAHTRARNRPLCHEQTHPCAHTPRKHADTHTHTHAHTHARMHARTHARTHAHTCAVGPRSTACLAGVAAACSSLPRRPSLASGVRCLLYMLSNALFTLLMSAADGACVATRRAVSGGRGCVAARRTARAMWEGWLLSASRTRSHAASRRGAERYRQ